MTCKIIDVVFGAFLLMAIIARGLSNRKCEKDSEVRSFLQAIDFPKSL